MTVSFVNQRTIRFSETDASGFAYFDTYIRLMEETEYAFLRSRGLRVVLNDGKGIIGFPRVRAQIQIIDPVRFADAVCTELRLESIDGKQIRYAFTVKQGEGVRAEGQFEVACCRFPAGGIPYAILTPDFVMEKLVQ